MIGPLAPTSSLSRSSKACSPSAGKGVDASLLGSVTRTDGKVQVTYAKQPLYYFAGEPGEKPDRKPGDVNGQHLFDVWYVMSPAGSPIKKVPKRG